MSRFVLTAQLQLQAPNNVAQVVRQIQSQLNNVNVNLNVQGSAQAQRQLQQVTAQTQAATTAADRMGRAFAISVRRFAAFSIATRAVSLFTSTLADAVKSAIDFERQMIKVAQVTGESLDKLNGLTKTITNLSTSLGVPSQELLNVSQLLLQAGINAKDTEVALKTLAKAALAPNFDSMSETAEGAIAILAQFGEGVGALEKQLGSINAVAGAFAVEAGDLIDVIRRTGGVFKASGGDLNELLALFTSVRATTRESAESIGTGLRTIFTRIQRPKTIEFLKQFGVELVDLNGKFVGPYEAIKRLSEALSGLGEGDITFIRIAEELGGFRQIGKVLPLLQQFSTAQQALNVANKAGASLTNDAATAQQALAVRITKVKEEFLALIRSVTETSAFQIMANTALSFASALIKIGEAIKPLLPLLATLAAVNLTKGIGSFIGGFGRGMKSGRTYNTGGKVHHFARGGFVPGSGNRDTVPAMLSPGEFVIRKSSVKKLGAGNLAAMNENRYAIGGIVGGIGLTPSDDSSKGSGEVSIQDIIKALLTNSNLPGGTSGNKRIFEGKTSSKQAQQIIANIGGFSGTAPSTSRKFSAKGQSFKDADLNKQIGDDVERGMSTLIGNAASVLGSSIGVAVTGSPNAGLIKSIGSADVMGKIFEGALNLLGAPFDPLAAKQDRDAFDFPSGLGGALGSYFKGFESIPVDAKKNITPAILDDIATRKTKNLIAGQVNTSQQFQALKKTKQMATGGGVGTDTVPALLTPGEFVVNRSSAQRIGYGNLNRMNKIGRYASGGIVHKFNQGGTAPVLSGGGNLIPFDTLSRQARNLANAQAQLVQQTKQSVTSQQQQKTSIVDVVKQNRLMSASIAATIPGMIQGFLPALDDSSGALLRMGHSLLNLTTTIASVGLALEAFGMQLTAKGIMDFFSGKGLPGAGKISQVFNTVTGKMGNFGRVLRASAQASVRGGNGMAAGATAGIRAGYGGSAAGMAAQLGTNLGKLSGYLTKITGPAIGVGLAFTAATSMIDSFNNHQGELNKAIQKGNIEQAKKSAVEAAGADAINTLGTSIIGISALFGPFGLAIGAAVAGTLKLASELPVVGPALKSASIEIMRLFGGNTASSIEAFAASQAGATKTQKELEQAQKIATRAMEDFERGTISAADALSQIDRASSGAIQQQERASKAAMSNLGNRSEIGSGAIRRNLGAYLGGGLFGMETAATRNERLGKESADEIRKAAKFLADRFQMMSGARTAAIRSAAFSGSDVGAAAGINDLRALRTKQEQEALKLLRGGDNVGFEAMKEAANQTAEQIAQVEREMANLSKEVETAKAKFAALNLGFRSVLSASDAAALKMTNLTSSFEVGNLPVVQAAATLEAALTSAGQNISKTDFDAALSQVNDVFKQFGASADQIAKFNGLISGVAGIQREFPQIFEQLKKDLLSGDLRGINSPEKVGERFKQIVDTQLRAANIGDAAREQIIAAMGNVQLSPEDVNKIISGDYSVLEKYLGDAAEEVQKNLKQVIDNYVKVNQELIKVTQQRIEAERNFVEAQREAVDLFMEGREVQAKYGGRSVGREEKLLAILAKANARPAGVPGLRTGSAAELRARNAQLAAGAFNIEARRRRQDGMAGRSGVEAEAEQKNLIKAQKDQIQTIRDLIKLEEESLRIVQEKNKLEKDSLNSLISGDIEKFFEQQAAVGAQAALAAGDTGLANMFGADAVGAAFQDILRQMEAGVDSLFGRQLGGPGGLAEQAARAALAARGVMDPRMAQTLAGTTPEEQAIKNRLQELGAVLGETGAWQQAFAEMELQTAEMRVAQAQIIVDNLETGGTPAQGRARGGLIYANRGMFIPRGTDTVPAMLTPGEFVVRREAVNRGNNLQLLRAINSGSAGPGFSRGGKVGYYNNGGMVQYKALGDLVQNAAQMFGINPELIRNLGNIFTTFNNNFQDSIKNLQNTKLKITLDSVNVNVNINGGALASIREDVKREIMNEVVSKIRNEYGVTNNGIIREKSGNLPTPTAGM